MKILYIAYSCNPYEGSEDKIGWCVPFESAKTNQVYVITKEEQRAPVEKYMKEHPQENLHFYYVDIPNYVKKIFRGFFYSGRIGIWNKCAYPLAEKICRENGIEIIHQITPVEFRSIGDYGSIPNTKFVCGPIAGGQSIPQEFYSYLGGYFIIELIRGLINKIYRGLLKRNKKLRTCDYLLFANQETKDFLSKLLPPHLNCMILPDVAVDEEKLVSMSSIQKRKGEKCRFVVVGRLVYLKGHSFLLDALARLPKDVDYECIVVGEGKCMDALRKKCKALSLEEKVSFVGSVPHSRIDDIYGSADVLVMPSFREATGSVLIEAMAMGLTVISINKFGGAIMLGENTDWLYSGQSKKSYIDNLNKAMIACIANPEEVFRRKKEARTRAEVFTWQERIKVYQLLYNDISNGK